MLYIAGILHFDPLCRGRLLHWLQGLDDAHMDPPQFIAVEWDQDIFAEVVRQRPILRQLAKREWPQASSFFLDALSEAMGFEGDTHVEVFPNIPILWLDQGRSTDQNDIKNYARDRLNVYRSYLPGSPTEFGAETLYRMSKEAWSRGGKPTRGDSRDAKFANLLIEHRLHTGQAIAIVGANHSSAAPGSMWSILREQRILCEVILLKPN